MSIDPLTITIGLVALAGVGLLAYSAGRRSTAESPYAPAIEAGLEESDFYPFVVNPEGHVGFDAELFSRAVRHLLEQRNDRAGRELVVIGEQNLVRDTFASDRLEEYRRLYAMYDGDAIVKRTMRSSRITEDSSARSDVPSPTPVSRFSCTTWWTRRTHWLRSKTG